MPARLRRASAAHGRGGAGLHDRRPSGCARARAGLGGVATEPHATSSRPCRPCHPCHPCRRHAAGTAGAAGSGLSATSASVVSSRPAIDAAFCSAARVTLAGSMTPALTRSSNSPVAALRPMVPVSRSTCCTTTAPSRPALSAISRAGASSALHTMRAPVASSPSSFLTTLATAARAAEQGGAAAGDDALLDGRTGGRQGVLDAVLLLLELDLGGRADLDDGDAAGQLGQALLELLAVPVGVGVVDLPLDLGDAALDVVLGRRRPRRWWCRPW